MTAGTELFERIIGQRRVLRAHRWGADLLLEVEVRRDGRPYPVPFVLGHACNDGQWAMTHARAGARMVSVVDDDTFLCLREKPGSEGLALWQIHRETHLVRELLSAPRGVVAYAAGKTAAVTVIWADPQACSLDDDAQRWTAWQASGVYAAQPGRDLWPQLGHRPDDAVLRLAQVDLMPGGKAFLISLPELPDMQLTGEVSLTPDGATCAAGLVHFQRDGHRRFGLYVFDLADPSAGRTVWADADLSAPIAAPDGAWFACTGEAVATPRRAPHRGPVLVSREGDRVVDHMGQYQDWLVPHAWANDDILLCLGERDGARRLWRTPVDGGTAEFVPVSGSVQSVAVRDQEVLLVRSAVDCPPEVIAVPLLDCLASTSNIEVRPRLKVSTDADVLLAPAAPVRRPARIERRTVRLDDDSDWGAWLCLPTTDDGAPWPVLVWCHGGPLLSWTDWSWRWNPWPFVADGYAVLMIDPPLSLGYGRAAVDRGWGRWRTEVTRVAARQVSEIVAGDPRLDGRRMAVMGASFGAWLALSLSTVLPALRLVASHCGWVDSGAVARTCDLHWHWLREYGPLGSPAYERETVSLADVPTNTRVLLSHGMRDAHVPVFEALGIHRELDARGVDVRLMILPDEGHAIRRPANASAWFAWVKESCDEWVRQ